MEPLTSPLPTALRTARLVLRRPTLDDRPAVFAIEGDPRTAVFRAQGPRTREVSDAEVVRYVSDWSQDGLGYWLVEADGAVVGITGQRVFDAPFRLLPEVEPETLVNTYYRFSPAVWGTGVPTEAVRAALEATLAAGVRHDVVALTTPDNLPSLAMARRVGMTYHRRVPAPGLPDTVEHRLRVG